MHRGPVAEIDLSALRHNLGIIRKHAGKSEIIAVVKADAYGHGAAVVAGCLAGHGVSIFAVAYTEEAKLLRAAGISSRIIVLFDQADVDDFFAYDLVPVLRDRKAAEVFSSEAVKRRMTVPVHLKIDTGMGRIGFMPGKAVEDAVAISSLEGIRLEGLLSHFSEADIADRSYALHQLELFRDIRDRISGVTGCRLFCHMANSAAVFALPDAHLDAVRPGLALYGYSPFQENFGLKPVMQVRTKVLSLRDLPAGTPVGYGRTFVAKRDSKIAVVPVGYADGYNRLFSNNAEMLAGGKRVPVVGRVCMDVTMIDVTDMPGVAEGDEVVIMGGRNDDWINAAELASRINTIPYEMLTSLGSRSRKEYLN